LGHHKVGLRSIPALVSALRSLPTNQPILAADIRSVIALFALQPIHRRTFRAMVHGSEAAKFQKWSIPFQIAKLAYSAASMILFNSEATKDIFERGFGKMRHPQVSYLGVDEFWFEQASDAFEHPELAALPDQQVIICSVGRLEPRKGHIEALGAIARLQQQHGKGSFIYVIAGRAEDDGYVSTILAEARRLSVEVLLTGRLSRADLRLLYKKSLCHMLLASSLPGKIEGFGLVLLEAAAQECPSIATATGGIPEALGGTGVLVQEGYWDQAADGIWSMASDPKVRRALGRASRRHAQDFTWARCADVTFPEFAGRA
jgi:phosphatidylinositol alpha-1,6-mannosyltransferase